MISSVKDPKSGKVYAVEFSIGEGSQATVYCVKEKHSGEQLAMKVVNLRNMNELILQQIMREVSIHSSLNHPNVLKYHAHM